LETARRTLDSERLLMMAIELDHAVDAVWEATDELAGSQLALLLDILEEAPARSRLARDAWRRVITPERLRSLVDSPSPDLDTLERVLARFEADDAGVLLDLLTESERLATRRRLFTRLVALAPRIGPEIVRRLLDRRWFARRNMLALLGEIPRWPAKWSPAAYSEDPHQAVRREALKLMLRVPEHRDLALCRLLADTDLRALSLGLAAATDDCPPEAIDLLAAITRDESVTTELRLMAVRALARTGHSGALAPLVDLLRRPGRSGRTKLAEASPLMLAALQALATRRRNTPEIRKLLARAARAADPDVRRAAAGGVEADS